MVYKFGSFLLLMGIVLVDVFAQNSLRTAFISKLDPDKLLAKVGPFMQKCIGESGVDPKEINNSVGVPSHENLCFRKCLALEVGTIDGDGKLVPEKLKQDILDSGFPEDDINLMNAAIECLRKIDKKIQTCDDMMLLENCKPPLVE